MTHIHTHTVVVLIIRFFNCFLADEICTLHLLGQRPDEHMRIMQLLGQRIGPKGRPREQTRTVVRSGIEPFTGAALSSSLCAAKGL